MTKAIELSQLGNTLSVAEATGNVGVGQGSPVNTLHVGSTGASLRVGPYITDGNGDRDFVLLQAHNTDSYIRSNNERFHLYNNAGDIVFHAGSSDQERLRITSAGLITFPDVAEDKIQLNGNVANYYRISKLSGGGTLGDGNFKFTAGNVSGGAFTFHSGGSERVRITSGGQVSLGTASPYAVGGAHKLCIPGSDILSAGPSSTNMFYIRYQGSAGDYAWQTTTSGQNLGTIQLQPYGGSVGIGTTDPQEKLDVRGNLVVGGSTSSNYIAFKGTTGDLPGTTRYLHSFIGERIYSGSERSELLILKDNDVSGPSGADRVRIVGAQIRLDTYDSNNTHASFEAAANDSNNVLAVLVDEDGNVGIGTDNPERTLHVKKAVGGVPLVKFHQLAGSTSGDAGLEVETSSTGTYIQRWVNSGSEKARITGTGYLAVATIAPSYRVDIGDGVSDPPGGNQFRINASGDYIFALHKQSAASFSIRNNSTGAVHLNTQNSARLALGVSTSGTSGSIIEQLVIRHTGRVGIGTNDPSEKLHVETTTGTATRILVSQQKTYGSGTGTSERSGIDFAIREASLSVTSRIFARLETGPTSESTSGYSFLALSTRNNGTLTEALRLNSSGDLFQRSQRVHTLLHAEYRQLSGSVNTDSATYVDIKNFGYTPKRAGSLVVFHFQVQTWWGQSTNANGDIYFRARYDQGTGSYTAVQYGGDNSRMTGNFDNDSTRQHLFYTHTFGIITQNTNQHTINLQTKNTGTLSIDFNWFHTGADCNGCWIFEYDN